MMITPSSNDASAIFALLATISDPKAAKANLKELVDASEAYQKSITDSREELKKLNEDISAKKEATEISLAQATKVKAEFDKAFEFDSKELKTLSEDLAYRKAAIEATEAAQYKNDLELKAREKVVTDREKAVYANEEASKSFMSEAKEMRELYSSKLAAMKALA